MEIQLPIKDLKRGMYVVDLEGKTGVATSVFSVEGYVLSDAELSRLEAQGYETAFIDPARSRLPGSEPEPGAPLTEFDVISPQEGAAAASPPPPAIEYQEEYEKAVSLYGQGLEVTRALSVRVLTGGDLPVDLARSFAADALASIQRNGNALLSLAKMKDKGEYIFSHSVNVAILSVALGRRMGVTARYLPDLALAGFLHDVGKLFVPREILNHPGKLTEEQMRLMQSHVSLGQEYLRSCPNLPQMVLDGELDHHERYPGGGYPHGKRGAAISFTGRLMAVADVYDAVSSKRCYKNSLSPAQTLSIMYKDREKHFAPGFMECLISAFGVYPPGTLVKLSNGQAGVVIEASEGEPMRPKVVLLADGRGARVRPRILDLNTSPTLSVTGPLVRLPLNVNVEEAVKSVL